jgi:hypothetical protein
MIENKQADDGLQTMNDARYILVLEIICGDPELKPESGEIIAPL